VGDTRATARERERLRALQAYRRSDQAPDAALTTDVLLERLSRELRTPLNAVLGFAQLLSLEVDEPGQRDSVDQILRAGEELQSLVDGLVGATTEPADAAVAEPVPLQQAAQAASARVAPLARARSVALQAPRSRPGAGQPVVHADPALLHDAVSEVLAAAVRRARTEVVWSCTAERDRVLLTVVDDGSTAPSATASAAHLDLGLAVARRVAALLGGALTAGRDHDGRFVVVLDLPASPRRLQTTTASRARR
jgi:signal transduction histidine kinase